MTVFRVMMGEPNYIKHEEWKNTGTHDIMIFHPAMEEMKDFSAYISKCESQCAYNASGICKVWSFNDYVST
jgi:hypothetical protein